KASSARSRKPTALSSSPATSAHCSRKACSSRKTARTSRTRRTSSWCPGLPSRRLWTSTEQAPGPPRAGGPGCASEAHADAGAQHPGIELVLGLDDRGVAGIERRGGADEVALGIEAYREVAADRDVEAGLEREAQFVR